MWNFPALVREAELALAPVLLQNPDVFLFLAPLDSLRTWSQSVISALFLREQTKTISLKAPPPLWVQLITLIARERFNQAPPRSLILDLDSVIAVESSLLPTPRVSVVSLCLRDT